MVPLEQPEPLGSTIEEQGRWLYMNQANRCVPAWENLGEGTKDVWRERAPLYVKPPPPKPGLKSWASGMLGAK